MSHQTQYQKVREFMQAFGQECPDRPGIPSRAISKLRLDLITEESYELLDAKTTIDAFDAVLDLLYVVMGAGIAYGFSEEQVAAGLAEVHRSNLSKFWTRAEVQEWLMSCQTGITFTPPMTIDTTEFAVRYVATDPSGKIIKSPSYSKANLGPILEGKV